MATTNRTLNNYSDSYTLTQPTGTQFIFKTNEQRYVPSDISLTVNTPTASPKIKGGAPSGAATFGTPTNCVLSETNSSGIAVVTSGTCSRAAIQYDGAVNGWVIASNNATPTGGTASSAVNLTTTTRYLTKVTLTNGKTFQIEVPNGSAGTVTFTFSVDANGNTTIV